MSPRNLILSALTLLCIAPAAHADCLTMEDFPAGSVIPEGTSIVYVDPAEPTPNPALLEIHSVAGQFHLMMITATHLAHGSLANEMHAHSAALAVYPTDAEGRASFAYADVEGQVFLGVNGSWVIVDDFTDLPASLGGVDIVVDPPTFTDGYHYGTVTLTGQATLIQEFAIGGEHVFLDDVCWETPPVRPV